MLTSISRKASTSWRRLVPATRIHVVQASPIGTVALSSAHARRFSDGSNKPVIPELMRLKKAPTTGTMTKIICTIGPATDTPEKMSELVRNGMHVARLNFSHAGTDYTYPETLFNMLRDTKGNHESVVASPTKGSTPNNLRAVLVDTKGPGKWHNTPQHNFCCGKLQQNVRQSFSSYRSTWHWHW